VTGLDATLVEYVWCPSGVCRHLILLVEGVNQSPCKLTKVNLTATYLGRPKKVNLCLPYLDHIKKLNLTSVGVG
jgi:hypothetical protein